MTMKTMPAPNMIGRKTDLSAGEGVTVAGVLVVSSLPEAIGSTPVVTFWGMQSKSHLSPDIP